MKELSRVENIKDTCQLNKMWNPGQKKDISGNTVEILLKPVVSLTVSYQC